MIRELVELLLSKNCKVYFLPHSIHSTDIKSNDLEYYKKIFHWTKLENKVYIIESLEEVYDFYKEKKIDLCFAMRLHSMILSQVYEIPFVAFSYSKKTEELVKKIRNKDLINKLWD
jgi:polysaccharide pyruvyl transferase WcaK-like protein